MSPDLRIGTSGWVYGHWRDTFYPPGERPSLGRYAEHFDTVEINNSFYRLPSAETFKKWRDETAEDFLFAVKASRFITHMKKLKDPTGSFEKFFAAVAHLGPKLGPILFQFPPRWACNLQRLSEFLDVIRPSGCAQHSSSATKPGSSRRSWICWRAITPPSASTTSRNAVRHPPPPRISSISACMGLELPPTQAATATTPWLNGQKGSTPGSLRSARFSVTSTTIRKPMR